MGRIGLLGLSIKLGLKIKFEIKPKIFVKSKYGFGKHSSRTNLASDVKVIELDLKNLSHPNREKGAYLLSFSRAGSLEKLEGGNVLLIAKLSIQQIKHQTFAMLSKLSSRSKLSEDVLKFR